VPRWFSFSSCRVAAVTALAAALALAGCGRKGPLEAPPSASAPAPEDVLKFGYAPGDPANTSR